MPLKTERKGKGNVFEISVGTFPCIASRSMDSNPVFKKKIRERGKGYFHLCFPLFLAPAVRGGGL